MNIAPYQHQTCILLPPPTTLAAFLALHMASDLLLEDIRVDIVPARLVSKAPTDPLPNIRRIFLQDPGDELQIGSRERVIGLQLDCVRFFSAGLLAVGMTAMRGARF